LGVAQVDGAKLCAAEVDALEPGATKIGTKEVSHTNDANVMPRRWRSYEPADLAPC